MKTVTRTTVIRFTPVRGTKTAPEHIIAQFKKHFGFTVEPGDIHSGEVVYWLNADGSYSADVRGSHYSSPVVFNF